MFRERDFACPCGRPGPEQRQTPKWVTRDSECARVCPMIRRPFSRVGQRLEFLTFDLVREVLLVLHRPHLPYLSSDLSLHLPPRPLPRPHHALTRRSTYHHLPFVVSFVFLSCLRVITAGGNLSILSNSHPDITLLTRVLKNPIVLSSPFGLATLPYPVQTLHGLLLCYPR